MSREQWGHGAQQDIPSWPMTHLAQYGPFWELALPMCAPRAAASSCPALYSLQRASVSSFL